jgi:hypothetical protein
MTTEPRAALDRLIAALEAHLAAASRRTGEADPNVVNAYDILAEAFERYDDSLYAAYDEVTPFVLYGDGEADEDVDEIEDIDDLDDEDDDDLDEDDLEIDDELDDDDEDDAPRAGVTEPATNL